MKKIIAIIMMLFVLVSAVGAWGCNEPPENNQTPPAQEATINGKTAYQMYNEFSKAKMDNVRVTMTSVSYGYTLFDGELETSVVTTTTVADYMGDAFRMKMTINGLSLGEPNSEFETTSTVTYVDNVVYTKATVGSTTSKYKYVLTKNQFKDQISSAENLNTGLVLSKDDFKDLEFVEDGDNYKMTVTIDSSKLNGISGTIMPNGYEMTLSDFNCELKFSADGKLIGLNYACTQNVKLSKDEVAGIVNNDISTTITLEYDVFKSIDAPSDAKDYIEVLPQ